jgi:hypothetical protein
MMTYKITRAEKNDLPEIWLLFEEAIRFQKSNKYIGWTTYDKDFIRADVEEKMLLKIVADDRIACIFSICYKDGLIWREKEKGDALYLHRAVINQRFKGEKLFKRVLEWAVRFAKKNN